MPFSFWSDLIFKYHAVAKPASYGAIGVWDSAYAKNQVAMVPDGDWMRNWFPAHKNVGVKAVFMPKFGSKQVAWMSGHVIAAPASLPSEKKDAVYTFMRYLSSQGVAVDQGRGPYPGAHLAAQEPGGDEPVPAEHLRARARRDRPHRAAEQGVLRRAGRL